MQGPPPSAARFPDTLPGIRAAEGGGPYNIVSCFSVPPQGEFFMPFRSFV